MTPLECVNREAMVLAGAAIAIQGGIGGINMGEWVKVLYGLVASLLFGFAVGWLVCKAVTLICAGMDPRRPTAGFSSQIGRRQQATCQCLL